MPGWLDSGSETTRQIDQGAQLRLMLGAQREIQIQAGRGRHKCFQHPLEAAGRDIIAKLQLRHIRQPQPFARKLANQGIVVDDQAARRLDMEFLSIPREFPARHGAGTDKTVTYRFMADQRKAGVN